MARRLNGNDVLDTLAELFFRKGIPCNNRSNNGSEFAARTLRNWLKRIGVKTLFIEPGSPWENGDIESFSGKMRDEVLNLESFDTLSEAKVIIESLLRESNQVQPHSSLGYRPPAPEAILPAIPTWGSEMEPVAASRRGALYF